jgi:D-3-phosphoglycerate dehydrogenase
MEKMKVLIADGLVPEAISYLEEFFEVEDENGISAEDLAKKMPDLHAVIVRSRTKMTKELIEASDRLKVIGRAGVGVDNIDLATAQANDVTVVNAPLGATIAVAEHAIMLMLAMARSLPKADYSMKAGLWEKKTLRGSELYGKVLGVIGGGRIGEAVAKRAEAFGMKVVCFDTMPVKLESVSLETLYAMSDYITIHTPKTPQTAKMLDGQAFAKMKRGVRIVCTARGGIIDETSLLANLESGHVAGAALDVFEKEPPGLSALVAHPNVIATPHIGANTHEAQIRAGVDVAGQVKAALMNEPLTFKIV